MEAKEISLILRIEGGVADDGLLDVYDAANTIYGLARTVNLVTHSLSNKEEVRLKNQSAKGARAFVHSSKKGCFEEQVDIHFDGKISKKIGPSVITNIFWDYFTWVISASVGLIKEPQTPYVKKIAAKNDIFIYEIADALESPMSLIHKAITRDPTMKIFFNRPRVGDAIKLDQNTLDFVTTREEQTETEYISGNITKVNILSHFGRLYSDDEEKVISFALQNPDDNRVRGLSLKSMQEHNDGQTGKVFLKVSKIVSAQGVVKRYVVHDILEKIK